MTDSSSPQTDDGYLPASFATSASDEFSDGFFAACAKQQLTAQRCRECRSFQHPPRAMCSACGAFELEWSAVSGRGRVFSYTIVHHPIGPVRDRVPYNVVLVDLDDAPGVRLVSNLIDAPDGVTIGQPVEVAWERINDELLLPRFRTRHDGTTPS